MANAENRPFTGTWTYNNKKVKGVQFSFQKAPLLFIQDLNKLRDAQRRLQKTDYYRVWGLDGDSDMFY